MKNADTAAQIERIRHMERNLDEAAEAIKRSAKGPECCIAVRRQIEELSVYYGSAEWFADLDADSAGELPQNLKRGVLSQDAVYDLLMEYDRLRLLAVKKEKL